MFPASGCGGLPGKEHRVHTPTPPPVFEGWSVTGRVVRAEDTVSRAPATMVM